MDQVQCFDNESTLLDCPRPYAIGYATCNYNALAGVVCPSKKKFIIIVVNILLYLDGGPPCTNQAIRMLHHANWTPFNSRGHIEVCYNNQWETVCDNGWTTNDAKVACAQLGFSKDGKK